MRIKQMVPAGPLGLLGSLFFGALALLLACGGQQNPPAAEHGPEQVISKTIVMAPAAAEMLEALGLLDRVVGRGEFGPWPPEIEPLPSVGGYSAPNVERVLALGVELLITTQSEAAAAAHRRLEKLGVRVVALDTDTHAGIFTSLEALGTIFGVEGVAAQLTAEIRGRIRELEQSAAGISKRRVLFVVGRDPLYVAGPGSHIDRMIEQVGGVNVAADALAPYQQFSIEVILERRPEVIIDSSDNRSGAPRGRSAGSWARWSFLPAVADDRVHWVDPSQLVIPGIRLPEMTELMGRFIHPELFGEATAEDYGPVQMGQTDAASP